MDSLEVTDNSARLRRTWFACLLIYMLWFLFFAPKQQIVQQVPQSGDTAVPQLVQQTPEKPSQENVSVEPIKPKKPKVAAHKIPFSDMDKSAEEQTFSAQVSSDNGAVSDFTLLQYPELPKNNPWWSWMFDGEGDWTPYIKGEDSLSIFSKDGALVSVGVGIPSLNEGYTISKSGDGLLAESSSKDIHITKKYSKTDEPYIYKVDISVKNNTSRPQNVWVGVSDVLKEDAGRYNDELRPQNYTSEEGIETYLDAESLRKSPEKINDAPYWFGLGSRYFLVAAGEGVSSERSQFGSVEAKHFSDEVFGMVAYAKEPLAAGDSKNWAMTLYAGPKQLDKLATIGEEWGYAVDFGIFGIFSRALLFLLKIFYAGFHNWGVSIILLTLLVKVIFFPMTQKAFESGRKMQLLQPELNAIKEKYKDDKMLQSQETMKVFQKHKVSPAGGCLPTLIQMPVWFALYNALLYSVELYDSSFLYLQDLTSPDPYGVLPVLYGILMFSSQKLMRPSPQGEVSEQQAMMMKMMKYMTVMFTVFMFTFPSGLVIYFCCNMLLSTLQQVLIKRRMDGTMLVPTAEKG